MNTPEDDEFKRVEMESTLRNKKDPRWKEWYSLTDDEIQQFSNRLHYREPRNMVLAIQKALKDRNT
jgi:hypothetical protein